MFPNGWCNSFLEKYISCWSFQIINLQLKCQFAKEQELNRSSSLFHKVTLNFLKVRLNRLKDELQFSISPNTKLFWKKWDLMDCDSVTFPTHPSFPFTEPFAKLSRDTWKFNNHYCLFWFPHLMSIFIKFYIFSTGQMYLWHWFILFFWCKPPLSILQFVQSLVLCAIYLQKLNCIFVLSVAKPEFGKHWLN